MRTSLRTSVRTSLGRLRPAARPPFRTLALSALLFAATLAGTHPAAAHAILMDAQPAANGSVKTGPVPIVFRYNSRVDVQRSRLSLIRPDKTETVLPLQTDAPADQLLSQITLEPGAYTLHWQVLAVDGHITRGDVPFTVTP